MRTGRNTLSVRPGPKQNRAKVNTDLMAFKNRMVGTETLMEVTHEDYVRQVHLDARGLSVRGAAPRLLKQMELYETYFVNSLKFKYTPSVSVTQSGDIHFAPEYDPLDMPPSAEEAISTLASTYRYKSTAVSQPVVVNMDNPEVTNTVRYKGNLYTSPSGPERWCSYGQLLFYDTADALSAGTKLGIITMEYDITLSGPQLQEHGSYQHIATTVEKLLCLKTSASLKCPILPGKNIDDSTQQTLEQVNGAGSGISANVGAKYVGTYEPSVGATLYDKLGNVVNAGARLFWRPPSWAYSLADGIQTSISNSSYVGALNSTQDFSEAGEIFVKAASTVSILFKAIRWFES